MINKRTIEVVKLIAEVVAVLVSIVALIISFSTLKQTTEMAESANKPRMVIVDTSNLAVSSVVEEKGGKYTYVCKNRIRLMNIGGVDTLVQSITALVRLDNETEDVSFGDFYTAGYWIDDIFFIAGLADAPSLSVPSHSAVDIDVRLSVSTPVDKHYLVNISSIHQHPASYPDTYPDYSSYSYDDFDLRLSKLTVEYSFQFPDAKTITTGPLYCLYVD